MKKKSEAPSAELMYLAPCEAVAAKPWDWNPIEKGITNPWGEAVSGINSWFQFDTTELDE